MIPTVTERPTALPQVRLLRSDPEVDCFAVVAERLVLVVDTFGTPEEAAQMMERLKPELPGRALAVVNTPSHHDHAWGNQLFAPDGPYPAPIYAHEAGRPYWERVAERFKTKPPKEERFANVKLTPPAVTFSVRLTLHRADLTFELLSAPGHSADQVAVTAPCSPPTGIHPRPLRERVSVERRGEGVRERADRFFTLGLSRHLPRVAGFGAGNHLALSRRHDFTEADLMAQWEFRDQEQRYQGKSVVRRSNGLGRGTLPEALRQ